jgi:PAS domain S-box-containing protein
MSDAPYDPGPAALSNELLQAFLAESRELLAVTDAGGKLLWVNGRFSASTGYNGRPNTTLLDFTLQGTAGSEARLSLARMLSARERESGVFQLRGADGEPFWADARCLRIGGNVISWMLADITLTRALAARTARQDELLETAQEFGRLGIWEREIPSGEGRWDKHVFEFWGLDPADGTPNYNQAIDRIHVDDRAASIYPESTRRPGRYSQRFRVVHPDGRTRWIHSQWEVMNGPRGVPDRALGVMVDDTEAYEAARTLNDVNAQLRLAVELGRIASWRRDLRTGRITFSDHQFELLGIRPRPPSLSVDELRALVHPDDLPLVAEANRRAFQTDEPVDSEARYRRTDGAWRYFLSRRVVERDASGQPIAFVGVTLDTTERVEHLRHAEELARRLDSASRAAGIGIWTTTVDPDATDWNAQMFELFDRHEPPHAPRFGEWLRRSVHPDDRARIHDLTHAYFANGNRPSEMEFRALRKDGSVRWIVLRADVDREHSGPRRVFGIAMDVTAQRRALDALEEASERAAMITRHAGIGTWEVDADGKNGRWDAQMFRLRGLEPRDEMPDRDERVALTHPDDVAFVSKILTESMESYQPAAYEFRARLPDGSYRWLASRSATLFDDSGTPVRRVGVNWDITESKNADLARQQAAFAEREIQAKSQFLSRMSHELRTPLNAVLGFTQLLQIEARQSGQAAQLAKLEHIRDAGDHLLSLINDVLDLSGLESGEIRLTLQPVDLGELVRQSLPLVHSLAVQHDVELEIGRVEGTASADPTRLRQVLINLLSNAIKYNRAGGKVVVDATTGDHEATLTVRDTGRGLDAEQLARLFEPFNRFGVEHEGIEGTGIGLTIVKTLVDGMGGRIDVDSQPGQGTVFRIALAAANAAAQDAAATRREVRALDSGSGRRRSTELVGTILYIEDNHVNVLLVEELVKSVGGLAFTSEASGAAGVERAIALLPDLVLVDLQLPDFDGYEVLRRLRADARTHAIPCVALSANAMQEDIARGLESGFVDYWTKPIDFAVFVASLERLFPALVEVDPAPIATAEAEHSAGE